MTWWSDVTVPVVSAFAVWAGVELAVVWLRRSAASASDSSGGVE